ncbi:hypothetical protein GP486_006490 [Trichoglossum hirsutum]|uniref:Uncharacterized protein n=1 Tax=Trichoglossum hirsutum TaxID=265104 RepID=A0A9P8IJ39_9PEZI|nr:hypothetical protein GP486_006490 [Trichoglossum hirsutum]
MGDLFYNEKRLDLTSGVFDITRAAMWGSPEGWVGEDARVSLGWCPKKALDPHARRCWEAPHRPHLRVMTRCDDKIANVWAARFIPLLLAGIVGYVSWVVVKLVCVGHLLRPPPTEPFRSRHGPAVGIIVAYLLVLAPLLASYFRIIYTIATDPGYVPRGELWHQQRRRERREAEGRRHKKSHPGSGSSEKRSGRSWLDNDDELGYGGGGVGQNYSQTVRPDQRDTSVPPPGLDQFYTRDAFTGHIIVVK